MGGSLDVIQRNCDENFSQTERFVGGPISTSTFDAVRRYTREWLEANRARLDDRIRSSKICDGHGDVRCDSVCIEDAISIFDCIEFNERFRFGDVASEVAFLAMDLAARGRPDLGYVFAECYEAHSGDAGLFLLLSFYRCYRAFVRGKVLGFQSDESEVDPTEREAAATCARAYFEIARRYAMPLVAPAVVAVSGLSGTGKRSVARAIAEELGLRVVSADAIRIRLFGETAGTAYGGGSYTSDANRATYRGLIDEGRRIATAEGGVVLDAMFRRAADRAEAREMAADIGAAWRLVECRLAPNAARTRIERRTALGDGLSDATWETHLRQRGESEAADASVDGEHLVLDTDTELVTCARRVADWLLGIDGRLT